MKARGDVIMAGVMFWLFLFAAMGVATSCNNISSTSGTVSYTPATGEITAGITITFKAPPGQDVVDALERCGAVPCETNPINMPPLVWKLPSVTNDQQRLAVNRALLEGATLTAP